MPIGVLVLVAFNARKYLHTQVRSPNHQPVNYDGPLRQNPCTYDSKESPVGRIAVTSFDCTGQLDRDSIFLSNEYILHEVGLLGPTHLLQMLCLLMIFLSTLLPHGAPQVLTDVGAVHNGGLCHCLNTHYSPSRLLI